MLSMGLRGYLLEFDQSPGMASLGWSITQNSDQHAINHMMCNGLSRI